jgi:hypothetical protein
MEVLNHLIEAWNSFSELPVMHPSDVTEFQHSLHQLQCLIGIRIVRRLHPDQWYNAKDPRWEPTNIIK